MLRPRHNFGSWVLMAFILVSQAPLPSKFLAESWFPEFTELVTKNNVTIAMT